MYHLPPYTMVMPSMVALHLNPKYWGDDAEVFRPSRWIISDDPPTLSDSCANERLREPVPGTYFPWSDGSRICPGKKFSQVESIAVLARLFSQHFVQAVPQASESPAMARRRIEQGMQKRVFGVALLIKDAEKLVLSWALHSNVTWDDK